MATNTPLRVGRDWGMLVTGVGPTANLLKRIGFRFDGNSVYVVGPTVEYAVYNELGTSRMPARPFMRPAAERVGMNVGTYAQQVSRAQGIALNSEENIVRSVALAVQAESRRIADAKGVRDTGALIASISIEKVR